jgi:hypothetical protein
MNEVTVGVITVRQGQALMKFPKERRADILQNSAMAFPSSTRCS